MVPEPRDWQLQCQELKQRVSHVLQSGLWSDCSFLVGTEPHQVSVPGHKLILSMASPVFETMFYGSLAETSIKPIPIKDFLPEAFKALLEYIYTDKINISCVTNACELYYGAKKYMLPHLMKKCMRYIWASLCPKNVCYVYEFAKVFQLRSLLQTCEQIIEENASELLMDSSFEELEPNTVLELLSLRLRVGSELELFAAAERRKRLCAADDDVTVRSMIEKVRFLTLTPQQFAEGPAKSPLLTKEESFAVLTNIVTTNSHLPLPDGFSACRVPRRQPAGPTQEMSILDLNEECWRVVLDYVPMWDIISSELTSRGWQSAVLGYLKNIRIGIHCRTLRSLPDVRRLNVTKQVLPKWDSPSFELWCRKLGASVVFTCCASERSLKTIPEQFPNLKAITFFNLPENVLQKHMDAFKGLEYLCFDLCCVSDSCIAKFVASNELKWLLIHNDSRVTGECLLNIESTKLQSLTLGHCEALKFTHLSSAVKRFKALVELELHFVSQEIYENIHLLLPNTPNLQVLIVNDYNIEFKKFFGAVCKLSRLEILYSTIQVTDADLQAMAQHCNNLRVLMLVACEDVTGCGLRNACELAGARFTNLCFKFNSNLTNDDVAACIRVCPNLKALDFTGCRYLTRDLLPLAAAARRAAGTRRPLILYVADINNTMRASQKKEHEELIVYTSSYMSVRHFAASALGKLGTQK